MCVALGISLQVLIGNAVGTWLNFALAALIAGAFVVIVLELATLVLFSVFAMSWQPAFSFEWLVFSLLPFVVLFVYKWFPFEPWLTNGAMTLMAIVGFNVVFGGWFFVAQPSVFAWDVAISTVFAALMFRGLQT